MNLFQQQPKITMVKLLKNNEPVATFNDITSALNYVGTNKTLSEAVMMGYKIARVTL